MADKTVRRKYLDTRQARMLTSREMAKILNALVGGLLASGSVEDVRSALQFCLAHLDQFAESVTEITEVWNQSGTHEDAL